ncbi:MAG: S1C family serine protease [Symbiobacteriia bacterium]
MERMVSGPLSARSGYPRPSQRRPWLIGVFGLFLGAALVWAGGAQSGFAQGLRPVPATVNLPAPALSEAAARQALPADLTPEERDTVGVVSLASAGVVQILVDGGSGPHAGATISSGSGFVWDTAGHIITNNHVVEEGGKISVVFHGGSIAAAKVIGTDRLTDLAVLEVTVPQASLRPLALADSDQVMVGQKAVAIGSPLGIGEVSDEFGLDGEPTVTIGIISARDRSLPVLKPDGVTEFRIRGLLQTDAAINPGNSGGPLLNSRGQVVGVNTAIIPTAQGIGFAIPANVVNRVAPQLISQGKVVRPQLGVEFLSLEVMKKQLRDAYGQLGLPVDRGALVTRVVPGSGAAAAGIQGSTGTKQVEGIGDFPQGGDIIVGVNGRPVAGEDLPDAVLGYGVGDRVTLSLYRGGQLIEVQVTLGLRQP